MKQKTSAPSRAQPPTDCQQIALHFQALGARQVVADFSGGYLSSDGGALLLRQVDRAVGLSRALAGCFDDRRDARFVEHGVAELVAQRLYALALGYEDLNDHADLRRDPLLAVAANKPDPLGTNRQTSDQGRALAAPATLQRMESAIDHPRSRYHKLAVAPVALRALLLQQGIRTPSSPPGSIPAERPKRPPQTPENHRRRLRLPLFQKTRFSQPVARENQGRISGKPPAAEARAQFGENLRNFPAHEKNCDASGLNSADETTDSPDDLVLDQLGT